MKTILPKTLIDTTEIADPFFFLAGPDLGGGNWRERFCELLAKSLPEFYVVVPSWKPSECFLRTRVEGWTINYRQTVWERYFRDIVNERSRRYKGCVVFWLPVEDREHPRDDGQPYARDTYGELGRWGVIAALTSSHIVVGADPGFPGIDVIQENLRGDFGKSPQDGFPIYSTIEETVRQVVQWVKP